MHYYVCGLCERYVEEAIKLSTRPHNFAKDQHIVQGQQSRGNYCVIHTIGRAVIFKDSTIRTMEWNNEGNTEWSDRICQTAGHLNTRLDKIISRAKQLTSNHQSAWFKIGMQKPVDGNQAWGSRKDNTRKKVQKRLSWDHAYTASFNEINLLLYELFTIKNG